MGIPLLENLGCKELYKAHLTQLTVGIPLQRKTVQNVLGSKHALSIEDIPLAKTKLLCASQVATF